MSAIRFPFATSFLNRSSSTNKDSKIVNAYVEHYSQEQTAIVKRPGLSFHSAGVGCGQGIYSADTVLYAASGNTVIDTSITEPGKTWTEATPTAFVTGRTLAPLVVFNNKLWYLGGLTATTAVVNDVYSSSDGITWVLETTVNPFTARYGHSAVVFNSKLWVIGGFTGSAPLNDVWSSVDGITWVEEIADSPGTPFAARSSFSCIVYNSKIWVMGGFDGTIAHNDVWSSINGTTWVEETSSATWTARLAAAITIFNNQMWLSGGQLVDQSGAVTNDVWYSTNGITWTEATAAAEWSTRLGHSMSNFSGYLFVVAGSHDTATSLVDVWKSLDGITWTQVTGNTDYGSRTYQGSVIFNGNLWIAGGGIVGGSRIPSVWYTLGSTQEVSGCIPIHFIKSSSSSDTQYIMYKSLTQAEVINIATKATSAITDPDYPATTVPGIVFLDGYFFVMTPNGEIYNSNLEDPTSWNALDFITAEMEPDDGVAIFKHLNYIVAFGKSTTEFFYDAANASGSPLARVDNAFMFYGCATGYSVVHMNNTLVWMSQTQQQGKQIAIMNGFAPLIISTPFVERIIAEDDLATVYSFNTKVNGHDFYVLTLGTSNITLVYDFTSKLWYQWSSMRAQAALTLTSITLGTDGTTATVIKAGHGYADGDRITIAGAVQAAYNGDFNISYVDANTFTYQVTGTPVSPATGTITSVGYTEGYFRGVAGTIHSGTNLIQDETTGDLYEIDSSFTSDVTGYINMFVRTINMGMSTTTKKCVSKLEVIGDKVDADILVRYSNDDYVTHSSYRKVDLNNKRSQITRLGSFRRRSFDFRHTDDTTLRLEEVELMIEANAD